MMTGVGEFEGSVVDIARASGLERAEVHALMKALHRTGLAQRIGYASSGVPGRRRVKWRMPRRVEIDLGPRDGGGAAT